MARNEQMNERNKRQSQWIFRLNKNKCDEEEAKRKNKVVSRRFIFSHSTLLYFFLI